MKNEFKTKFTGLNDRLRDAIAGGDFDLAQKIDAERQYLLVSLMKADIEQDDALMDYIEQCARENAELVTTLETALTDLSRQASTAGKVLKAYGV
jgi:hypothetical protein